MTTTLLSRMIGATTLGAAVTTVVVLIMQSMIQSDQAPADERPDTATLTFLPTIEEQPPKTTRQLPPPPPPVVDPPPPPPPMTSGIGTHAIGVKVIAPALPPGDTQIGRTGLSDGDALPVVKVRPIYPNRARQQGLEGYVLVAFTIDELGRVVDARVVDAKPRGVFDHAALEAVARFRYKPRVVNGQATAVSGVEHLITFKLES